MDNTTDNFSSNIVPTEPTKDPTSLPDFVGESVPEPVRIGFIVLAVLLLVSGTLGNILVLLTLIKCSSLHSLHYVFVANLAIADLIIEAYSSPFVLYDLLLGYHPVVNNDHCIFNGFLVVTCYVSSLFTLAGISFNRYIRVCHNSLYQNYMTKRTTLGLCAGVWLVSGSVGAAPLLGWGHYAYDVKTHYCGYDRTASISYTALISVGTIALPATAVCYFNFSIFRYVKAANMKLERWKQSQKSTSTTEESDGFSVGHDSGYSATKIEKSRNCTQTDETATAGDGTSDKSLRGGEGCHGEVRRGSARHGAHRKLKPVRIQDDIESTDSDEGDSAAECLGSHSRTLGNSSQEKSESLSRQQKSQPRCSFELAEIISHDLIIGNSLSTYNRLNSSDTTRDNIEVKCVEEHQSKAATAASVREAEDAESRLQSDIDKKNFVAHEKFQNETVVENNINNSTKFTHENSCESSDVRHRDVGPRLNTINVRPVNTGDSDDSGLEKPEIDCSERQSEIKEIEHVEKRDTNTSIDTSHKINSKNDDMETIHINDEEQGGLQGRKKEIDPAEGLSSLQGGKVSPRRPKMMGTVRSRDRSQLLASGARRPRTLKIISPWSRKQKRINELLDTSGTSTSQGHNRQIEIQTTQSLGSRRHLDVPRTHPKRPVSKRELNMIKTLFLVFVCLSVFMSPYMVSVILDTENKWPAYIHLSCSEIAVVNNAVNWILYGLMNRNFRAGYRSVLSWLCPIRTRFVTLNLSKD
ncbi:muscarinic acetylcholine receptor gar-3 [Aplysia californica]|uniref:Muscarinic acetylcholine receptor gar-3 n=1 Tax=Aplysia californica TaxID=6500 RepID=A0ABM1A5J7_APLCA|nr:muscarinic acetylcholine receptor gar-3 [Aplysia californica]